MEENKLITAINDIGDIDDMQETQDDWYACGTYDYCDLCVGICKPQYH